MSDLYDPPKEIVLHDDPWLQAHTREHQEWTTALSGLLPGSRPKDLSKSDYYLQEMRPGISREWCHLKCATVCDLIDSIIENGFRKSPGIGWSQKVKHSVRSWVGPVGISVGSDGNIHFWDGHHRKAICWLLGIPLPAFIIAVNSKWKNLWDGNAHYDFYPHPFVSDATTVRVKRNSRLRLQRIVEWLRGKNVKSVIDIGSFHGHFPVLAAKAGMEVQSVEIDDRNRMLGNCWYKAEQVCVGQHKAWEQVKKRSEAITCLNVLHYMAKTQDDLRNVLSRFMRHRVMVLELSNDNIWWGEDVSLGRTMSERILSENGYSSQTIYCDPQCKRLTVAYYK